MIIPFQPGGDRAIKALARHGDVTIREFDGRDGLRWYLSVSARFRSAPGAGLPSILLSSPLARFVRRIG